VFRVRNLPAALYKALGGFATNGVNMTKLESYMIEGNFFATMFYADVEGHPDDRGLAFALEELKFFSRELTILGVIRRTRSARRSRKRKRDGTALRLKRGEAYGEKGTQGPAHAALAASRWPSADPSQLLALVNASKPFYEMLGGTRCGSFKMSTTRASSSRPSSTRRRRDGAQPRAHCR
jgi:hypothetical protein